MKIVGSRYFHPNIVFREMSLTTLLCMVKHSASVGHQVQHATWSGPRPAVVNGENGSCVVWTQHTDNQTNRYFGYMYHAVTE